MTQNDAHNWVRISKQMVRVDSSAAGHLPLEFTVYPIEAAPIEYLVICEDCELELPEALTVPCSGHVTEDLET
jgi:hypothetical protein